MAKAGVMREKSSRRLADDVTFRVGSSYVPPET
jgi:hypothetical protein